MSWRKETQFRAIFFAFVPAAFLLGAASLAYGDRVYLANGEVLEGIIGNETDASVALDIGMGSVSVKRSRIDRIEREDETANQSRRSHWRATYIDVGDLPDSVQTLARHWDRLTRSRATALRSVQDLSRLDRESVRLERVLDDRKKQYLATNRKLGGMSADKNREAYNAMVSKNNRLVAGVNDAQTRIKDNATKQDGSRKAMAGYARALTAFQIAHRDFTTAFAAGDPEDLSNLWLRRVGKELESFDADFVRMTVPVNSTPGGRVAQVQVNDEVTGAFLVDTGASVVTLSETMAKRLRLRYDPKKSIAIRLADGEMTEAIPVWLQSLQVGDARAENVQAVVMATAPGPELDGLLGMTFLSQFHLSFNGQDGEMVLRALKAK